jgi:hypothetical protein
VEPALTRFVPEEAHSFAPTKKGFKPSGVSQYVGDDKDVLVSDYLIGIGRVGPLAPSQDPVLDPMSALAGDLFSVAAGISISQSSSVILRLVCAQPRSNLNRLVLFQ